MPATGPSHEALESTILILADGRVLARNVTPELAALLRLLEPENTELAERAQTSKRGHASPAAVDPITTPTT